MTAVTADLAGWLARAAPKITVVGDAILDVWLSGRCDRVCREAPAPVVDVRARSVSPGGAANTAVNLAAMGARVRFVTVLGDDEPGRDLTELLARHGIDTAGVVVEPGRRSVRKQRVIAGDQVLARFDDGDVHEASARAVTDALRRAVKDADALVVCDYLNGLLGPRVREEVARLRAPLLVVDAHDFQRWRPAHPDLVTPNAAEAARVLGAALPEDRVSLFERMRTGLLDATGARAAVVTLDRDGALLVTRDGPGYRTWAEPVPDSRASGAGDTFVAGLCLGAAAGLPLTGCVELAQTAAGVAVRKNGTAVCGRTELAAALTRDAAVAPEELAGVVDAYHETGRRVVFTNGCFDVLHRGHITYLTEAKRQGDILVVALNSDESVRRLKGPGRPVNSAPDRAAVLSALGCVDHVTVFEQDTPIDLLRRLKPDLYVKGGDYTESMLAEAPVVRAYGGEVRALGYVPDRSTTSLIARIRESTR